MMAAQITWVPNWQDHLNAPLKILLNSIGADITTDAKRIVPVLSGDTQDSIEHHSETRNGKPSEVIQAHTDYSGLVEIGTSKMAPQPYLKPSLYKARG